MRGQHMQEKEVTHCLINKLTISASAPVESHVDGEVQEPQTHFEIEILPGALRLF